MTSTAALPPLVDVLIALNVVLCAICIPLINRVDNGLHVFHTTLAVNAFAVLWWIFTFVKATRERPKQSTNEATTPALSLHTRPVKPTQMAQSTPQPSRHRASVTQMHSCSPVSRTGSEETLVEESGAPKVMHTSTRAPVVGTPVNSPRSASRRQSDPPRPLSSYPSTSNLPLHLRVSVPEPHKPARPSPESQSQTREMDELRHSLRTSGKERDMYRTRALQLALRLDDSCRARAQTEEELECVQRDLAQANRVTDELEEERRDLSVALAVVLTGNRTSAQDVSPLATLKNRDKCVGTLSPRPAHEEAGPYPRTPTKTTSEEKRPLLLPPTASTILDTPTRSRLPELRSKSALEDLMLDKRRRGSRARAQSRTSTDATPARPIFTIEHADHAGDRRDTDLRASRQCTTPGGSPELVQEGRREIRTIPDERPAQREALTVPVEILRQPFGPPPSPKTAEKGHGSGINRGEHTWRGRVRSLDATSGSGPTTADAENARPYPGSRMPNRMRQRQTTAPPASTAGPSTAPSRQPRMTRAASIDAIGAERKRHATFNGRDDPGPATRSGKAGSSRWPKSAFGNGGGLEGLRKRSSMPFPSAHSQRAESGSRPTGR
ncbi:hypothetical protein C8Q79DRAFT_270296 [Trametes meyenii]|nr:hypothetical protein C8Q79DRAFT_270296 [Trametes meyenii]